MSPSEILILCALGIPMYIGAFFAYRSSGGSRNVFIQGFALVTGCLIAIIFYLIANEYSTLKVAVWLGIIVIILCMAVIIGIFGVREKMRR